MINASEDAEILAIKNAYDILGKLDHQAAARVIRWLTDRIEADMVRVDIEKLP